MSILQRIADALGMPGLQSGVSGFDRLLPFLERMREDGAVVVLKFDGQRTGHDDTGAYTAIVSSPSIAQGGFIRIDAETIEEAAVHIIERYASEVWHV
jgi:hypothetical protein